MKFFILLVQSISSYPVETGRKLNVHTTFRRRPGRLLNVIYMFNLRPVSTGKACNFIKEDSNPGVLL